ncbi:uncharacterized protein LODBEIA_P03050 [Lodderomyces beijingensis]|uniref:Uncharacterized protein n=1 Tax=Lodderomyces beijingensis TaxID=1775926 RepID=A0ABP0ZFZ5_9ASCO
MSSSTEQTKPINRLVILYGEPKFYHTIILLKEIRELPNNYVSVIEVNNIEKVLEETTISSINFDYLHICIEFAKDSNPNLQKVNEFLRAHSDMLAKVPDIGYHIHFQPGKEWSQYSQEELDGYFGFLRTLRDVAGDKVTHCSIVNKYDMDTMHITDKEGLEKLGREIQSDIQYWKNLKFLDFSESSLRSFQGIKLPETLEVLNIGGGYALDSLLGFTMPSKLKTLIAGQGAIAFLRDVKFPSTLETLELQDNKIYFLEDTNLPASLKHLDVSQNRLEDIWNVDWPKNLESLNLGMNPIESMRGMKLPERLKYLEVSCMPSDSMAGLKFPDSLEVLNLSSSMTNARGLKIPPNVKTLVLSGNYINSVNPLKLPNSVEILYLNNNNIKTLNKVSLPPKLQELYLGDNQFTTLKNVVFPDTLQVLDLENNPESSSYSSDKQITTLRDIVLPPNLKTLKMGYHGIRIIENYEFPATLRHLGLAYNELKYVRSLKFGNQLKTLDLSGNPELLSLDNVIIPTSVTELRVSPGLIPNLPASVIERANKNILLIKKAPEMEHFDV